MPYIVHKAIEEKNLRKGSAVYKKLQTNPKHLEETYWRQLKYDGCNCVVVSYGGGDFQVFSRTGEVVKSMDHLLADLEKLPAGVYLGEAWRPHLSFPEISGIFRRQTVKEYDPLLHLVVFDVLTLEEWEAGYSLYPYAIRYERAGLRTLWLEYMRVARTWAPEDPPVAVVPFVGIATDSKAHPLVIANALQNAGGFDGLILRDPEGTWTKGDGGGNGEIIKVKPRLRTSCRVIGWEAGKGKHEGRIGTLLVEYNGKLQGAGTGLKDHERGIVGYDARWRGRMVEIEALGVTADGYLREPVLLGIRDDVLEAD